MSDHSVTPKSDSVKLTPKQRAALELAASNPGVWNRHKDNANVINAAPLVVLRKLEKMGLVEAINAGDTRWSVQFVATDLGRAALLGSAPATTPATAQPSAAPDSAVERTPGADRLRYESIMDYIGGAFDGSTAIMMKLDDISFLAKLAMKYLNTPGSGGGTPASVYSPHLSQAIDVVQDELKHRHTDGRYDDAAYERGVARFDAMLREAGDERTIIDVLDTWLTDLAEEAELWGAL